MQNKTFIRYAYAEHILPLIKFGLLTKIFASSIAFLCEIVLSCQVVFSAFRLYLQHNQGHFFLAQEKGRVITYLYRIYISSVI